MSSASTPQSGAELGHVAAGHQIEPRQQRLHGRIEPVAGLELQGQAFGQIARAHADGIEALQHAQHGLDILAFAAQAVGDVRQVGAQIAGLVHRIDQGQQIMRSSGSSAAMESWPSR